MGNIRSRILCKGKPVKQRFFQDIVSVMQNGVAIEFIYCSKDGESGYQLTAPICLYQFDGYWYLLGADDRSNVFIYALDKIETLGEEWTTFSLSDNLDYRKFTDDFFDITRVL